MAAMGLSTSLAGQFVGGLAACHGPRQRGACGGGGGGGGGGRRRRARRPSTGAQVHLRKCVRECERKEGRGKGAQRAGRVWRTHEDAAARGDLARRRTSAAAHHSCREHCGTALRRRRRAAAQTHLATGTSSAPAGGRRLWRRKRNQAQGTDPVPRVRLPHHVQEAHLTQYVRACFDAASPPPGTPPRWGAKRLHTAGRACVFRCSQWCRWRRGDPTAARAALHAAKGRVRGGGEGTARGREKERERCTERQK